MNRTSDHFWRHTDRSRTFCGTNSSVVSGWRFYQHLCRCLTHYWWVDKQQTRCWNSDRCPFCANTSLLDHASAKGQKSRSWQEFRVLAALPQLTSRGWQQNTLFPHTANQISSTSLRKITRSLKCFFMSMIKTDFVVRSDSISLSISCSLNSCCVWRRLWGNSEGRPWM